MPGSGGWLDRLACDMPSGALWELVGMCVPRGTIGRACRTMAKHAGISLWFVFGRVLPKTNQNVSGQSKLQSGLHQWQVFRKLDSTNITNLIVFSAHTHIWNTILKKGIILYHADVTYQSGVSLLNRSGSRAEVFRRGHFAFKLPVCLQWECEVGAVASVWCSVQCNVCKGHLHCIRCTDCQDGSSSTCTCTRPSSAALLPS